MVVSQYTRDALQTTLTYGGHFGLCVCTSGDVTASRKRKHKVEPMGSSPLRVPTGVLPT